MTKRNYIELASTLPAVCERLVKSIEDFASNTILGKHYLLCEAAEELCAVLELMERVDSDFETARLLAERVQDHVVLGVHGAEQSIRTLNIIAEEHSNHKSAQLSKLALLDQEEVLRVDEAWHAFQESCYWSTILNCAVAFENRLWKLLDARNPELLKSVGRYPNLTLGELSNAYLNNKPRFGHCVPKKYDGLLTTVNDYRIISAHAKASQVLKREASALFDLVLTFLMDEDCLPRLRPSK